MGAQATLPGAPFRQGTRGAATQAAAPFTGEQEPPSWSTPSRETYGAVPVEESQAGGNQLVPHAGPPARCTPGRTRPAGIDNLTAARAEALFASDLSQWASPAEAEVAAAIKHALRVFGGTRGCAGEVAAAFGEHPETAVSRMRWALQAVTGISAAPMRLAERT